MVLKTLLAGMFAVLGLLLQPLAVAANSQDFGQYVVHFNALTTDSLPPNVTRQYGITRSKNRAMINITVLKKVLGTTGQPVAAKVIANASNLTGHKKDIELREIREAGAIYYIGEFGVTNEENLEFTVIAQPSGQDKSYRVEFQQQFFTR